MNQVPKSPLERVDGRNETPDPADFRCLAIAYLDAAYNLAQWLVGDVTAAEGIVLDAYLRAATTFDEHANRNNKPWLLKIVRTGAYARLGDLSRARDVLASSASQQERSDEAAFRQEDEASNTARALADLAAEIREVVILREFEGASYTEIADITGVPVATVLSRLAQGRHYLIATLSAQAECSNKKPSAPSD